MGAQINQQLARNGAKRIWTGLALSRYFLAIWKEKKFIFAFLMKWQPLLNACWCLWIHINSLFKETFFLTKRLNLRREILLVNLASHARWQLRQHKLETRPLIFSPCKYLTVWTCYAVISYHIKHLDLYNILCYANLIS